MTLSLPQLVRQARELLESHQGELDPTAADVDSLTDAQLEALAGPGFADVVFWDEHGVLPETVAGLQLLADILDGQARARESLAARRAEPPEVARLSDADLESIVRDATDAVGPLTDEALEAIARRYAEISLLTDEELEAIARGSAAE